MSQTSMSLSEALSSTCNIETISNALSQVFLNNKKETWNHKWSLLSQGWTHLQQQTTTPPLSILPLSIPQSQLYLAYCMHPKSTAYMVHKTVQIHGIVVDPIQVQKVSKGLSTSSTFLNIILRLCQPNQDYLRSQKSFLSDKLKTNKEEINFIFFCFRYTSKWHHHFLVHLES